MTIRGSDDVGFAILGGFNLLSNLTDLTENSEAVLEETTVLGDSWQQQAAVGLNKFEIGLNGFYDDADNLSAEALSTRHGSTAPFVWAPATNAVGQTFRGGVVNQKNISRVTGRGALHKFSATLVGDGITEDGVILKAYGASTGSTGNTQGTSYDGTSSSTKGGAGYMAVSTITLDASTALTLYVRHSADNNTFADLITFTASSASEQRGQRVATAASTTSVDRYLAAAWAFSSTAPNSSHAFTAFIGFARNR